MAAAAILGIGMFFVVILLIGVILNGWAFTTLWNWFIASLFAVPELSIAEGMGVALVVAFITQSVKVKEIIDDEDDTQEIKIKRAICSFFLVFAKPLLAIMAGWIILQFIHE